MGFDLNEIRNNVHMQQAAHFRSKYIEAEQQKQNLEKEYKLLKKEVMIQKKEQNLNKKNMEVTRKYKKPAAKKTTKSRKK